MCGAPSPSSSQERSSAAAASSDELLGCERCGRPTSDRFWCGHIPPGHPVALLERLCAPCAGEPEIPDSAHALLGTRAEPEQPRVSALTPTASRQRTERFLSELSSVSATDDEASSCESPIAGRLLTPVGILISVAERLLGSRRYRAGS